ncbi:MAG: ABC transporter permease, partial [Armatimonadetes bacterium]|nr:ABC transporter permease [Armatimonadota bacterium]
MVRFVLSRLVHAAGVLVVVSLITFGIISLAPGGPDAMIDPAATAQDREFMRRQLGLDKPVHVRYVVWAKGILRGDFGRSFTEGSKVLELIGDRLPATILLTGTAFLAAIAAAIPAGILSALRPYSTTDYAVTAFSFFGVSIPSFWFGIMLIIIFAVQWRVLPAAGMATVGADFSLVDRARHLVMPTAVLATLYMAELARYTRSAVVQVKAEDYVRTARAKGLPEGGVISRHILRNALIPVVTVIGLRLPRLVGGAAITESIFAWPGMGRLAIEAAYRRDYPVVLGITIIFAVVVVASNLLVDLVYGWL